MSTGLQTAPQTISGKLSSWVQSGSDARTRMLEAIGGLPSDAARFLNQALVSFQTPEIMACTPQSQLKSLFDLCAMGLLPQLQQAALIVRGSDNGNEVTVMPQWQGYASLMLRYPEQTGVLDVKAELVHIGDTFAWDAESNHLTHTYDPLSDQRVINSEADIRGGYLKVIYRDGRPPKYHFVTVAQIVKARSCAKPSRKTGKREIWDKWFNEQALKTIYRNAYARRVIPVDPLAARHLEALTQHEDELLGNDPNRVALPGPDAITAEPPPKHLSKVEAMAAVVTPPDTPPALNATSQPVTEPEAAKQPADPTTAQSPAIATETAKAMPATTTGHSEGKATGQPTTTTTAPVDAAAKTADLARQLQEQFPTGQHGTVAADAPAGTPPTAPPAKFAWKTATPEARTAYTLQQVRLVDRIADPTQGLKRLANISQGIKEVDVGKPGYQQIMQAITAAERAFTPPAGDDSPFPPDSGDVDVAALVELCNHATDAARLDELERSWRDDANNFPAATIEAGLEEIAKARQGMRQ